MACNFHLTKCFLVCLVIMTAVDAKAGESCKTNEINGPSGVCYRLCGDMFKVAFESVCFSQRKREDAAGSGKRLSTRLFRKCFSWFMFIKSIFLILRLFPVSVS